MKYGAIPTSILERLAFLRGRVPIPLVDTTFGLMKARALMAGVRLGVFEAMREGHHSAQELAGRLSLDADTLELLLRVLVNAEYLVHQRGRFALSKLGRRNLISGAEMELFAFVESGYMMWEWVEHLEEVIRTGKGLDFHSTLEDPVMWKHYQRGMLELARLDAPVVAARVPVPQGPRQLLDLGGSHGLLGAAICRRHPPMRSTVIDLPAAIPHARELARTEKIDDIVEHRAGDLLRTDFGSGIDVILLANVLHHFRPEHVRQILVKAHTALRKGGTIAIWDREAPPRGSRPTSGDGVALFFRLTSTAAAYGGGDYTSWLTEAGFPHTRLKRPIVLPGRVLVTGVASGIASEQSRP